MNLSDRSGLVGHIKMRDSEKEIPAAEGTSSCFLCAFKTSSIKGLIQHYNVLHGKDMKINKKMFENREKFEVFKTDTEKPTCANYVKGHGNKKRYLTGIC